MSILIVRPASVDGAILYRMTYLYLAIAIAAEVIATCSLKATDGFTHPLPSVFVIAGYALAFYMLSLTLRTMQVGVAYAIWCGVGILFVTLISTVVYKQVPDLWAMTGMALIMAGVLVIHLLSKTTVS